MGRLNISTYNITIYENFYSLVLFQLSRYHPLTILLTYLPNCLLATITIVYLTPSILTESISVHGGVLEITRARLLLPQLLIPIAFILYFILISSYHILVTYSISSYLVTPFLLIYIFTNCVQLTLSCLYHTRLRVSLTHTFSFTTLLIMLLKLS